MDERKALKLIYASTVFIVMMIGLLLLLKVFQPSGLLQKYFYFHFNNPWRVDSLVYDQIWKLILLGILALLFFLGIKYSRSGTFINAAGKFERIVFKVLSLKFLFIIIVIYLIVLFVLAVWRYDMGVDEAVYPLYAGNFWSSGYAFSIYNAKPFIVDNFTMLPVYIASIFNFAFNLTDVWHFKLLSSSLSLIALFMVSRICRKLYNSKTTVLFLFFLGIQPGFGFVASSFFGEIVQSAFFFTAVYIWLKDDSPLDIKKIFIISLLFAISIQTKFQLSQALILTLILFHFIDSKKRALSILFLTFAIVITISVIRFIPALIQDKTSIVTYLRFWGAVFDKHGVDNFLYYIDRTHFFNRFLPVIFLPFLLAGIFSWSKTPLEKFLSLFTLFFLLWWIFYFKLSNYRVLFIGIIPLCFLLAAFTYDYYQKILQSGKKSAKSLIYISFACIFVLLVYGFSQNLIYATIGNNDAVQFDLDETKSRLFTPITHDNSQKEFYKEAKTVLQDVDSIYFAFVGQACFVPQFYLGEYRIFDYQYLINSLEKSPGNKFVIIDRTTFPLGLEGGYRRIDTLNVQRNLILKRGDYELYSVFK